jgi:hypothetical protein
MRLKEVILVSLSVALFAGAGYIVYSSLGSSSSPASDGQKATLQPSPLTLFPLGETLDFSAVRQYNPGRTFNYPEVVEVEVGIPLKDLMSKVQDTP